MSRPAALSLPADTTDHRLVPMPGSLQELALRRLDSRPGAFVIHGIFPPGFDRTERGGYRVAEEFLVLAGAMVFDGVEYGPGMLVSVPAYLLRTGMNAPSGCTVLAWFSGPAEFVPAAALEDSAHDGLDAVDVLSSSPGIVLETAFSQWIRLPAGEPLPDGDGDVLDAGLGWWQRRDQSGGGVAIAADRLIRIERN